MRTLVILTLALLMAGCASPTTDHTTGGDPGGPSGGVDGGASHAGTGTNATKVAIVRDTVDWSDQIAYGPCVVASGTTACFFNVPPPTNLQASNAPAYHHALRAGSLRSGNLSMTWDDSALGQFGRLQMAARIETGCPSACTVSEELGSAEGSSPLTLHLAAAHLVPGQIVSVRVVQAAQDVSQADVRMNAGEAFHVTGDLVFG